VNTHLDDRILSFLAAHRETAFKTKELARELDLPKQGGEYQSLKAALRRLQLDGRIARLKNSRWMLSVSAEPIAPDGATLAPDRATIAPDGEVHRPEGDADARGGERHATTTSSDAQRIVGVFKQFRRMSYVEADDRDIEEDIAVSPKRAGGAEDGDKVVVRLLPRRGRQTGLEGEVIEVLGRRGRADVEMLALARRYGLQHEFPADVDAQTFAIPARIDEEELRGRWDLRDLECFTIDPEDARDFDDAVSLGVDAAGDWELGVHIADVSHYVPEDSPLDREALRRGTSVYLVDGVFPMLPERLSNHMCSLKEGKDRLAFSVFVTVSARGAIRDYRIGTSVINSRRRFTYEEVQAVLDGGESPHATTLREMERLAGVLMRKRFREGSVDFNVPEVRCILDETGHAVDIVPKPRLMSMRMIEEFMLLANRVVAQHVARGDATGKGAARGAGAAHDARGRVRAGHATAPPFIYRVHDLPDPEKVRELIEFLRHVGLKVTLDPASSRSFQEMLEQVRDRPEEAVVQDVTIRSMAKAVYSEENIGHFGLGFRYYTHFTSPIRRYPDLVVHRLLRHLLETGGVHLSRTRVADIARQSSLRERVAVEAERASIKIKQVEFMKRHEGDEFDAVVSGVTRYGLYVEIYPSLVEGLVHVRSMDDFFEFDRARMALIGQRSGRRYRLGDRVRVRVAQVDSVEIRIDFVLVDDGEHERRTRPAAGGRNSGGGSAGSAGRQRGSGTRGKETSRKEPSRKGASKKSRGRGRR
jgi:ribonuclease R